MYNGNYKFQFWPKSKREEYYNRLVNCYAYIHFQSPLKASHAFFGKSISPFHIEIQKLITEISYNSNPHIIERILKDDRLLYGFTSKLIDYGDILFPWASPRNNAILEYLAKSYKQNQIFAFSKAIKQILAKNLCILLELAPENKTGIINLDRIEKALQSANMLPEDDLLKLNTFVKFIRFGFVGGYYTIAKRTPEILLLAIAQKFQELNLAKLSSNDFESYIAMLDSLGKFNTSKEHCLQGILRLLKLKIQPSLIFARFFSSSFDKDLFGAARSQKNPKESVTKIILQQLREEPVVIQVDANSLIDDTFVFPSLINPPQLVRTVVTVFMGLLKLPYKIISPIITPVVKPILRAIHWPITNKSNITDQTILFRRALYFLINKSIAEHNYNLDITDENRANIIVSAEELFDCDIPTVINNNLPFLIKIELINNRLIIRKSERNPSKEPEKEWTVQVLGKLIGKGGFGKVYLSNLVVDLDHKTKLTKVRRSKGRVYKEQIQVGSYNDWVANLKSENEHTKTIYPVAKELVFNNDSVGYFMPQLSGVTLDEVKYNQFIPNVILKSYLNKPYNSCIKTFADLHTATKNELLRAEINDVGHLIHEQKLHNEDFFVLFRRMLAMRLKTDDISVIKNQIWQYFLDVNAKSSKAIISDNNFAVLFQIILSKVNYALTLLPRDIYIGENALNVSDFFIATDLYKNNVPPNEISKYITLAKIDLMIGLTRLIIDIHGRKMVHWDLKPDNILVDEQNGKFVLSLIDFGSANAKDWVMTGTMFYLNSGFRERRFRNEFSSIYKDNYAVGTLQDQYALGITCLDILGYLSVLVENMRDVFNNDFKIFNKTNEMDRYSFLNGELAFWMQKQQDAFGVNPGYKDLIKLALEMTATISQYRLPDIYATLLVLRTQNEMTIRCKSPSVELSSSGAKQACQKDYANGKLTTIVSEIGKWFKPSPSPQGFSFWTQ